MTFTETTTSDSTVEGCETIVYTISSVDGAAPTYSVTPAQSTICDVTSEPTFKPSASPTTLNPTASPTPEVSVAISSLGDITEGEVGYFQLTLSSVWNKDVDVLVLLSGTATMNTDYITNEGSNSATYTIPAGSSTYVFAIISQDDTVIEGTETVIAIIGSDDADVTTSIATLSIDDGTDTPQLWILSNPAIIFEGETGTFTVSILNGVTSTSGIVVPLDSSSSLAASTEFDGNFVSSVTIPAGDSSVSFTLVATTDDVFETDKIVTYTISPTSSPSYIAVISSASITIVDTAGPTPSPTTGVSVAISSDGSITEGETGNFYLTLDQVWYTDVIVSIVFSGSASSGVDYTSPSSFITIPAGDLTKVVNVLSLTDLTYEGDELVVATIAPVTTVTVTQESGTLIIVDSDDQPTVTITATGEASIYEGTGNTIFTFSITNGVVSASDITVNIDSSGSVSSDDFESAIPTEVTISAGSSNGYIIMVSVGDTVYEAGQDTIIFTIVSGTGYSVGSPSSATHALLDSTSAPTHAPSPSPTSCGLGGEGSIALCELYQTTAGENWVDNGNWMTNTRPCTGSWVGVTCEDNSWGGFNENGNGKVVTHLSLNSNNLNGYLPTEMGLLTGLLNGFEFKANTLTQTIPTELGHFSLLVTKFKLGTNQLTSTIPSELGLMTALTKNFGLQNNLFTGSIPSTLGQMTVLTRTFSLQTNALTGTVPSELGQFTDLVATFNIGSNHLQGTLPVQLSNLNKIEKDFIVKHNSLSGSIPSEYGLFTSLTGVYHLNDNKLSGSIPSHLGQMTSMNKAFFLHENSLTGSIPSELGVFTQNGDFVSTDTAFLLRDNSLCGIIPDELTSMSIFMEDVQGANNEEFWEIVSGNPDICRDSQTDCVEC